MSFGKRINGMAPQGAATMRAAGRMTAANGSAGRPGTGGRLRYRWLAGVGAALAASALVLGLATFVDVFIAGHAEPPDFAMICLIALVNCLGVFALGLGVAGVALRRLIVGRPLVSALLCAVPVVLLVAPTLLKGGGFSQFTFFISLPPAMIGGFVMGRRIG